MFEASHCVDHRKIVYSSSKLAGKTMYKNSFVGSVGSEKTMCSLDFSKGILIRRVT